jgi:hypothetical protein
LDEKRETCYIVRVTRSKKRIYRRMGDERKLESKSEKITDPKKWKINE